MTYIERNKSKRGRNTIITISLIVAFFAASHYLFPHFFPALLNTVARPFWRLEFAIQNGSLSPVEKLLIENQSLSIQLAENNAKMTLTKYIEDENAELRTILGMASSTDFFIVPILKKPPFINYDELMIDAGRNLGLSTTSLVYALGDIPIGRVIEIYDETAKVLLFSSPHQKIEVEIGPQNIPAIAVGRGGGQYEAEIPRGLAVSLEDFVISAQLGSRPVGKVITKDSDPSLTFEKIYFAMPVNIYEMKWVKVDSNKI